MLAFQYETFVSIEDYNKPMSCLKELGFVSQFHNHLPDQNETDKPSEKLKKEISTQERILSQYYKKSDVTMIKKTHLRVL